MNDINFRIFIFSQEQRKRKIAIEGRHAKFGTVIVNGAAKPYTEIVRNMAQVQDSDAKVLTSGDIRRIKFTSPDDE